MAAFALWQREDPGPFVAARVPKPPIGTARTIERRSVGEPMKAASPATRPAAMPVAAETRVALPAPQTPLRLIFDDLKRLSEAGDVRATCRLAFEVDRCARLPAMRKSAQEQRLLAKETLMKLLGGRLLESADRLDDRIRRDEAACEDFSLEGVPEGWRYQLAAAQAGHEPSMIRFVGGSSLFAPNRAPLEALDGWIAYRDNAAGWFATALQAGDPAAFELAAHAHMRGDFLGMVLVPKDPVRGAAYYQVLAERAAPEYMEQAQGNARHAQARLSPEQLRESQEQAAKLRTQIRAAPGTVDFSRGSYGKDDGSHCETP